jgi:AAA family ATP:ADP antiporter
MSNSNNSFGKIRSILFPIYTSELKKFIPLALVIFSILFNYTVLRNMKDTLVVNAAGAGVITFLKLYYITPCTLLFIILFISVSIALSPGVASSPCL